MKNAEEKPNVTTYSTYECIRYEFYESGGGVDTHEKRVNHTQRTT